MRETLSSKSLNHRSGIIASLETEKNEKLTQVVSQNTMRSNYKLVDDYYAALINNQGMEAKGESSRHDISLASCQKKVRSLSFELKRKFYIALSIKCVLTGQGALKDTILAEAEAIDNGTGQATVPVVPLINEQDFRHIAFILEEDDVKRVIGCFFSESTLEENLKLILFITKLYQYILANDSKSLEEIFHNDSQKNLARKLDALSDSLSPLAMAANDIVTSIDCMVILEKQGMNVDAALQSACAFGQIDMVKNLLDIYSLDIFKLNSQGDSAFTTALKKDQPKIISYLIEYAQKKGRKLSKNFFNQPINETLNQQKSNNNHAFSPFQLALASGSHEVIRAFSTSQVENKKGPPFYKMELNQGVSWTNVLSRLYPGLYMRQHQGSELYGHYVEVVYAEMVASPLLYVVSHGSLDTFKALRNGNSKFSTIEEPEYSIYNDFYYDFSTQYSKKYFKIFLGEGKAKCIPDNVKISAFSHNNEKLLFALLNREDARQQEEFLRFLLDLNKASAVSREEMPAALMFMILKGQTNLANILLEKFASSLDQATVAYCLDLALVYSKDQTLILNLFDSVNKPCFLQDDVLKKVNRLENQAVTEKAIEVLSQPAFKEKLKLSISCLFRGEDSNDKDIRFLYNEDLLDPFDIKSYYAKISHQRGGQAVSQDSLSRLISAWQQAGVLGLPKKTEFPTIDKQAIAIDDDTSETEVTKVIDYFLQYGEAQAMSMFLIGYAWNERVFIGLEQRISECSSAMIAKTSVETNAIMAAATSEYSAIKTVMLYAPTNSINKQEGHGRTALMYAITHATYINEREDIVRFLLEQGADPNIQNKKEGFTALHYAAKLNLSGMVSTLLDQKITSAAIQDKQGKTALHHAVAAGNEKIVKLLLDQQGSNIINIQDSKGNTALHNAAQLGQKICVDLLCAYGADRNKRNRNENLAVELTTNPNIHRLLDSSMSVVSKAMEEKNPAEDEVGISKNQPTPSAPTLEAGSSEENVQESLVENELPEQKEDEEGARPNLKKQEVMKLMAELPQEVREEILNSFSRPPANAVLSSNRNTLFPSAPLILSGGEQGKDVDSKANDNSSTVVATNDDSDSSNNAELEADAFLRLN